MKLRAIRLENVRRFSSPVMIDGIKDGLNVLSLPNESGKSTFLDALRAVFFWDRKSWDRDIRSLVPYAGGNPSVAVDVEFSDGGYRIEKQWKKGAGGTVRVLRSGDLFKQADEAEDWIKERMKPPKKGGPAALFWVRQGQSGLDKDDDICLARSDLLKSVAGEVEAVAGGQRMKDAQVRCQRELECHLTRTGRVKSDGPLKEKMDEVDRLREERDLLAEKSRQLREELDRRQGLRRQLRELDDPERAAQLRKRIEEAQRNHEQASRHAEKLAKAQAEEGAKRAEQKLEADRLGNLEKNLSELAAAQSACRETKERDEQAAERMTAAAAAMAKTKAALDAARQRADAAEKLQQQAMQAASSQQRRDLAKQLSRAEEIRGRQEQAEADVKAGLSTRKLKRLEELDEQVRMERGKRDLDAAAVTMSYASGRSAGVRLDGQDLREGRRTPLPDDAQLEIEGLGRLTIHSGRRESDDALAAAEAELKRALDKEGLKDIDAARDSGRRREEAEQRRREAEAQLQGVAPDGIEDLRRKLAELPEQIDGGDDIPSVEQAQAAVDEARRALAQADGIHEAARGGHEKARDAVTAAAAAAEGVRARQDRAAAALAGVDDPQAEKARLEKALSVLEAKVSELCRKREGLEADAPDMESARVALERAKSSVAGIEEDRRRIREDLSRLDGSIGQQAGDAVDEELEDARARLDAAEEGLARTEFEVEVLKRLAAALENARSSVHQRHVEPVLKELRPLLRSFWPEARRLDFDGKMLPDTLVRDEKEKIDSLSGGTQEQVALLVRLAFASMLARAEVRAPVILDDAIVHTDDDRIERMFDVLTRQAEEVQIIVFSCRQRAFRNLRGCSLEIAPAGREPFSGG